MHHALLQDTMENSSFVMPLSEFSFESDDVCANDDDVHECNIDDDECNIDDDVHECNIDDDVHVCNTDDEGVEGIDNGLEMDEIGCNGLESIAEEPMNDVAGSAGTAPEMIGNVTFHEAVLLLNTFMLRYQLTRQAKEDLLSLLQFLQPNKLPPTTYLFEKEVLKYIPPAEDSIADSVTCYCCQRCQATSDKAGHCITCSSPYAYSICNEAN